MVEEINQSIKWWRKKEEKNKRNRKRKNGLYLGNLKRCSAMSIIFLQQIMDG